jgi:large subunit ribosomal protein L15
MDVTSLPSVPGAMKRRKRVGRGIGSGHGKTATRGQKGQRARTGSRKRPGFEGGQNPLIRRLPKRGFKRKATTHPPIREIINVGQLDRFPAGAAVTPEALEQAGLIRDAEHEVKLLGEGALKKKLSIKVHAASRGAKDAVAKAGGTLEFIAA